MKIKTAQSLLEYARSSTDIEIFGMFGPGNLGDEAMLYTELQYLPEHRCIAWHPKTKRSFANRIIREKNESIYLSLAAH